MSYKPGDPYVTLFTTSNPTTGAAQNADSLPVATANRNGNDDGAFTLTVANLDTGRYRVTGTIPGGYVSGDTIHVTVAATVAGVAAKASIDKQILDSKRLSDIPTFPSNFSTLAISGTGAVTVGTNNDKSGYILSQSFPANFASLVISGTGAITVGNYETNKDPAYQVSNIQIAGISLVNALKWIGATTTGVVSGAGSGTEIFKDFGGNVAVTVTVDTVGNRTSVTRI